MKEATGELNMTVITVVAIAAVGLLFTIFVWPNIQANLTLNTACSQGAGYESNSEGTGAAEGQDGYIKCTNLSDNNQYTCTVTYNGKTYSKSCTRTNG